MSMILELVIYLSDFVLYFCSRTVISNLAYFYCKNVKDQLLDINDSFHVVSRVILYKENVVEDFKKTFIFVKLDDGWISIQNHVFVNPDNYI